MSGYFQDKLGRLFATATGALVAVVGPDGREHGVLGAEVDPVTGAWVATPSATAALAAAGLAKKKVAMLLDYGQTPICPQFRQAWAPPPAYAASTYYARGQSVVNAGRLYTAMFPGTTGAASAPTTTTTAQIADGTVLWLYAGETFTADPAAPTVVSQTGVPAMTKFYSNTLSTYTVAGATAVRNDAWFNLINGIFSLGPEGIAGTFDAVGMGGIGFFVDSATFAIVHKTWINYGLQIAVDGQFIQATTYRSAADGQETYHVVTLKERKPKSRITVYWDTIVGGSPLRGVLVPAANTVWAESVRPRLMLVADSFGVPKGQYDFGGHMQMSACIGAELGCINAFGQAVGGSGYVQANTAPELFINRVAYVGQFKPDVLIIWGSINDKGKTAGVLTAGVVAYLAAARAQAPDALIVVLGVAGPSDALALTAEAEIKAGFIAANLSNAMFIPVANPTVGPWVTNGSTDYTGADGTHPVQAGISYYARRIGGAVRAVLAA